MICGGVWPSTVSVSERLLQEANLMLGFCVGQGASADEQFTRAFLTPQSKMGKRWPVGMFVDFQGCWE